METNFCKLGGGESGRLLIVGGGDIGVELARRLAELWRVTLLDLDCEPARKRLEAEGLAERMTFLSGDASSRLVLEKAGVGEMDAALLTTRPDEVSLEVARVLRRDFGFERIWVLLRQAEMASAFDELGVAYVHDFDAVAGALVGRVTRGSRVAGDVGLGRGEVLETEILPNSSVVGKPLSLLRPQRWLVAAVYRNDSLVVPHGDTTLEEGDRVLLVGDPAILPCIARFLRTGHSEFPLPYGTHLGVYAPGSKDRLIPELEYLVETTRVEGIEYLEEGPEPIDLGPIREQFANRQIVMRQVLRERLSQGPLVERIRKRDLGMLVVPPPEDRLAQRIGLKGSPLLERMAGLSIPVLVSRGTHPYRRIMFVVSAPALDTEAAVLAIDAARMLGGALTVAVGTPPDFVQGAGFGDALHAAADAALELARSYGVPAERLELSGNPVRRVLAAAEKFDLVVAGWERRSQGGLLRPGMAVSLVHRAPCSVMILPG